MGRINKLAGSTSMRLAMLHQQWERTEGRGTASSERLILFVDNGNLRKEEVQPQASSLKHRVLSLEAKSAKSTKATWVTRKGIQVYEVYEAPTPTKPTDPTNATWVMKMGDET